MVALAKFSPLARAVLVIGAVAALVTGVTFAALSSQATLTANTLNSATAELLVSKTNPVPDGSTTDTGFAIDELEPGETSAAQKFYLRNSGGVNMGVTVYSSSTAVTGSVDNSKVHFCFNRVTGGPSSQCFTRAEMLANFNTLPGGPVLADDASVEYEMTVKIDADHPGSGFSVAAFDLVFTGTQQP